MAICEEDKSAKYLQTGSYGLVSRIEGEVPCPENKSIKVLTLNPRTYLRRLLHKEDPNTAEIGLIGAIAGFQHNVLVHHQIGDRDISRLEKELQPNTADSRLIGAQFYGYVVDFYFEMERMKMKEKKIDEPAPPYTLGLVLADMLEVLPVETSSRLLLASADPEIVRIIVNNPRRNSAIQRIDPQPCAIEGIVLTPLETRRRIFQEMVALSPGSQGGARRFLSLIASNWPNSNSALCAQMAIYHNLAGEGAVEKILEVQADLLALGEMIDQPNS